MGTNYGIINLTRKEAIQLKYSKYGELINHANFITWLCVQWMGDYFTFINDKNSGEWDERFFTFKDATEEYQKSFNDCYWFDNKKEVRE